LLDEPLSNLDAKLREEMRVELRDLVKRLNITTLFVTHEQVEALTMSDMVAVMNEGNIIQQGPPAQIYRDPTAIFVANFVGKTNFLKATIASTTDVGANGLMSLETPIGPLSCRLSPAIRHGETVTITVRPENVELSHGHTADAIGNCVPGEVEDVVFLGNMTDCTVKVCGETIRVQLHPSQAPSRGDAVTLRFPVEHCFVIAGSHA
jgi:iron(III) transport system ATP-binding protein